MTKFEQIAQETARGWFSETEMGKAKAQILTSQLEAIILAAIEEATTDILIRHGEKDARVLKLIEQHELECHAAQPQRSEAFDPNKTEAPWLGAASSEHTPPADQVPLTIPGPHKTVADAMQEWTPETAYGYYCANGYIGIADAHNAALAAAKIARDNERVENLELKRQLAAVKSAHCKDCCCARSWKALGDSVKGVGSIPEHIEALRQELADEREKADRAMKEVTHLVKLNEQRYGQLLAAQAAIEKHNKEVLEDDGLGQLRHLRVIDTDLSDLEQHDKEKDTSIELWKETATKLDKKLKPLVEALEKVVELYPHLTNLKDLLASVKEGK